MSLASSAFDAALGWQRRQDPRLARSEKGAILPSVDNVVLILRNDPIWRDVIAFNEFSSQVVKLAKPPFERGELGEWSDMDDIRLSLWLAENYGIRRIPDKDLVGGVLMAGDLNSFHEVKDYLRALAWDGKPRLAEWLHAYIGAEQSDYSALVGTKFLIGAVARILRAPEECKVDNVLILEGPQGAGKSTALKALFAPWFTDASFEIGSTDGNQIIRGMWGVELAELDGFNRAEASRSKAFFTRTVDRYRSPYGRKPINVLRQCVFAGSVNHATYLKDDSGNRRYWPVSTGHIAIDELVADRDQLWAEAVAEFLNGSVWWVRASEAAIFEEQQDQRYIGDAWEDLIRDWLDGKTESGQTQFEVRTSQLLGAALGIERGKFTIAEQQRVGRIMARIGWPRKKIGSRGSREWVYVRPEGEE